MPTPTWRRSAPAGAAGDGRPLRGAQDARRVARLRRPAAARARPGARPAPRSAPICSAGSRTSSSTSSRTRTRCRPRSCCCCRPRTPPSARWQDVRPAPGKLFLVGDPKQSIYRFRRADVGIYQAVKDLLVARGAASVYLTTSFRAIPQIQNLVNAAFAPVMTDDRAALQAGYVPLAPHRDEPSPGSRASSRCRCRSRTDGTGSTKSAVDAVAARRGRRVRRLAAERERLEGHRARAARRSAADLGAPRVPAVPALHLVGRGRHARPTSRRSRRAASPTCWSAAARSTCARRSRACARR